MTTVADQFDIAGFKQAVERHWRHHAPSSHLLWKVTEGSDGWRIQSAPVYQEVVGGEQDGMTVWAGFQFDRSGFLAERGVLAEAVVAASYCIDCNETPYLGVRGTYYAVAFDLRVRLEPVPGSRPVEVIDAATGHVRAVGDTVPGS